MARLLLGAVWLWAGLSKVGSPRAFVQTVRAYDATPEWLSKAIGYGLPILEICLGVLLIVGVVTRVAAAVSGVLYVVFLVGLIEAGARGIKLECGCFGGGGETAGSTHYTLDILRDVGLLIVAAFLAWWSFTRLSLEEFLARNDYVEPPSAKRLRSEGGQRKYQTLVDQKAQQARSRSLYLNSSLSIVVVLVALIGVGVQSGRAKITGTTTATNATAANGVVYGIKAAATVDVYEDFQCPHCLAFETSAGATLQADARANKVQIRYHVLSFLDSSSDGNKYSSRAANAALCVSDVSGDEFIKFHNLLFTSAVQPAEGTKGRTDAELISYAQKVGLTPAQVTTFTTCIQTGEHNALVQAMTEDASKSGVTATPTVKVNGQALSSVDLATLNKAIAAADAKGPAPSKSPVPTPTTSAATSGSASVSDSASVSTGSATVSTSPSAPVSPTPSPTK